MARARLLCVLFGLFLTLPAFGQSNSCDKEVRTAIALWNERASHADLDGFMALLDPNGDTLLVGSSPGEVFHGNAAIRAWLATLFAHNTFSWDMSKAIVNSNGTTAWVFVDGTMTVKNDKDGPRSMPYRFSGALVKRKGVWKWSMFHGSAPGHED